MAAIAPQQFIQNPAQQFAQQTVHQTTASSAPAAESEDSDPKEVLKNHLKLLKASALALFRASRKLAQADAHGKKLPNLDGVTAFTKTELAAYQKQFASELSKLGKLITAALKGKKRSGAGNGHLSAPFFVSKQIPEFFANVNLGYSGTDAYVRVEGLYNQIRQQQGDQAAEQMAIQMMRSAPAQGTPRVQDYVRQATSQDGSYNFFDHGLASAQMLISLFRLYFMVCGLQSKSNGSYFNLNDEFNRAFGTGTNSHLWNGTRDLTAEYGTKYAQALQSGAAMNDEQKKLAEKLDARMGNMSITERLNWLAEHPDAAKKAKKKISFSETSTSKKETRSFLLQSAAGGTDAWGIAGIAGISRLVNIFRIPTDMLDENQKAYLKAAPAEGTDADKRHYAQRKTDSVVAYLAGRKAHGEETSSKKVAKSEMGLIDAQKFATHFSDEINTKAKRLEKSRIKGEKARQAAAMSATAVQYPAAAAINPSLIPSGMFGQSAFPANPIALPTGLPQ